MLEQDWPSLVSKQKGPLRPELPKLLRIRGPSTLIRFALVRLLVDLIASCLHREVLARWEEGCEPQCGERKMKQNTGFRSEQWEQYPLRTTPPVLKDRRCRPEILGKSRKPQERKDANLKKKDERLKRPRWHYRESFPPGGGGLHIQKTGGRIVWICAVPNVVVFVVALD